MKLFRVIRTGTTRRFGSIALTLSLILPGCGVLVWASSAQASGVQQLGDVHFGVWSPFVQRWTQRSPVCITADNAGGIFRIMATGLSPGLTFSLTNDINTQVSYKLFWHTGTKYRQRERLQSGVASRKVYTYSTTQNCADGPTGMLRVLLDQGDLAAAVPAVYSDTLLLMVVAQ